MAELLNFVGLGTGVALYAMLLAMVVRAPRHVTPERLPLATALLGLTWNLCALPLDMLTAAGAARPLPYLAFIGFSALGFLPAVVVHSALRTTLASRQRTLRQFLIALAYTTSVVAVFLHAVALAEGEHVPAVSAMRLMTYMFVALVVPVAFVTRHQPGGGRALSVAALGAFAVSTLHFTQVHTANDSVMVELAGHHASLPLAFAILYQEYRFALVDLFLKRALVILALVAAAFIALVVLDSHVTVGPNAVVGSRDVGVLVTLWVLTALTYPWLHGGVGWFVDRVVLQRPDYAALRRNVTAHLREHDEVEPLLDDMCRLLAPVFTGAAPSWVQLPSTPGVEGTALVSSVDGRVDVLIPTSDAPQYTLRTAPLTHGRRLLSDDTSTLEIVAVAVARRIDAIRLSRERWDRELREEEMSRLATEAELRALRAQINPHFLFNALTTLGYLIQTAPPRALDTLMRLTALLRGVLKSEGDMTTLGQELDLIQAYLDVESARFEERLDVQIVVPHVLRSINLPPLLLQPIVENAVKHGVSPQRNGARIGITAEIEGQQLCVSVRDTGAGATESVLAHGRERGVGLRNVERRLVTQYGSSASLTIESAPGMGTLVEIRLPFAASTSPKAASA